MKKILLTLCCCMMFASTALARPVLVYESGDEFVHQMTNTMVQQRITLPGFFPPIPTGENGIYACNTYLKKKQMCLCTNEDINEIVGVQFISDDKYSLATYSSILFCIMTDNSQFNMYYDEIVKALNGQAYDININGNQIEIFFHKNIRTYSIHIQVKE